MKINEYMQNIMLSSGRFKEAKQYWQKKLEGDFQMAGIPADYRFSRRDHYCSKDTASYLLPPYVFRRISSLCNQSSFAIYIFLLAGVKYLLCRYTGERDIVVGMPPFRETGNVLNSRDMAALRSCLAGLDTFKDLLLSVRDTVVEARKYSRLPFDTIARLVNLPRIKTVVLLENIHSAELPDGLNPDLILAFSLEESFIKINLEYNSSLYSKFSIKQLLRHLKNILGLVADDVSLGLSSIDFLPSSEKQKILLEFNDSERAYPEETLLVDLFEDQVLQRPDCLAAAGTVLPLKGGRDIQQISYDELNRRAGGLGSALREKGIKPNFLVGVMAERSLDMLIVLLGIFKSGGAYLPIDPDYPEERIRYILRNSGLPILFTNRDSRFDLDFRGELLYVEDLDGLEERGIKGSNMPEDMAYVIFTSGSTGNPKGAVVEHRGMMNHIYSKIDTLHITDTDIIAQNASHCFDISVWQFFTALLVGGKTVIYPNAMTMDPESFMDRVIKDGVSILEVVPSFLGVVLDFLDLVSREFYRLRYLVVTGEALKANLVDRWLTQYPSVSMVNAYGPTEASDDITHCIIETAPVGESIFIGRPIRNMKIYIMDEDNNLCPVSRVGEIFASGVGVGRGYLNEPDKTGEVFADDPFSDPKVRLYRTGDLGRWLPDGNIEFLGRKDYQVKVRGFRIELEEIESELLKYGDIDEAVVVIREDERGNAYLCGYMTAGKAVDISLLRRYLSRRLPDYMVPPYIIQLEQMPLTANGKIDRRNLPEPVESGDTTAGGDIPRTRLEERLVVLWEELLGVDGIGVTDNFFRLGGHSLKAASLGYRIQKELGIAVPLQEILKRQTIRELGQYIETATDKGHLSIRPVEKKEYYEVSSSQKRLLIVSQMEGSGVSYNMPVGAMIRGTLDRERLEAVFQALVKRHQTFRTSFIFIDGEPFQRIHDEADFQIEYYDPGEASASGDGGKVTSLDNVVRSFIRPFDLSHAPLLRVRLVRHVDGGNILLVDMHHTICDGMSEDILVGEFIRLYNSEELPSLRIQFKDFSEWQNEFFNGGGLKSQQDYWLDVFSGDIPVLDLPTDYPRPSVQSFEGEVIQFETDGDLKERINRLAQDKGATLFMVLMSVYIVLLSKYSHQEDIVVGTPIAGRAHGDLEKVIGMFVNTMAFRSFPSPDKPFSVFLEEMKQISLRAYENQDYPFEELVERLSLQRDVSRNPLFDVLFVLQNIPFESGGRGNFEIESFDLPMKTAKFDFILSAMEIEDRLEFSLEYCTKLYCRQTVERLGGHYLEILKGILADGEIKLSEIDILTEAERRQVLENLRGAERPYPGDKTVIRLFEEEVARAGDRVAVVGINLSGRHADDLAQLSYRELSAETNRLGAAIKEMGVGRHSIASIMVDISVDMLIGILGILKAGGAYLPISPRYPLERKLYLLEESQSVLLLVQKEFLEDHCELADRLGGHRILYIPHEERYGKEAIVPDSQGLPEDLIYIIYTSGTTGGPKGVLVENRNVVRLVKNSNYIDCRQLGRLLQSGALEFDASTFEIWGTLLNGSSLYLLKKETILSASELHAAIDRYDIGTMWLTAPLFNQMLDADIKLFSGLRNLLVGGDVLSVPHIKKLRSRFPRLKLINGYGPTENTTFSSTFLIERDFEGSIPVGRPIANSTVYILNGSGQPVPLGVYGELYTGGDGVSRGYLNDPDLSHEKYLSNPFVPGDRLYRTGDLVRWLTDGNIEFLHRLDCQVKIRGYRIELKEIENRLLSQAGITEVVVTAIGEGEDKYLCAYVVGTAFSNDQTSLSVELRNFLALKLPVYMIPSFFIRLERLPLTANGKVDRRSLPAPVIDKVDGYTAPLDRLEKSLVKIWSEVLGVDEHVIGIDSNFFEIGGHSLKATVLVSRIHRELGIQIPLVEIFKSPTFKEMAHYIKAATVEKYESIRPMEKRDYYDLSSAQKRLYILQQMEAGNVNYNIPQTIPLDSEVDKESVESTFRKLIARHESLRTSFVMLGDRPVQRIHGAVDFEVEEYGQESVNKLIKPFDLSQAPLLRVGLAGHPSQEGKYVLLVDMHHIISDGVSNDILTREFLTLFSGGELPPLHLQYKDYAVWQNRPEQRERVKSQESYWLAIFSHEIPVLNLAYDYPRPRVQSFAGEMVGFVCGEVETRALKDVVRNYGATLYMVLLSVFTVLLSKLSGQEDIVVGTPVAGRRHADLDSIIGMFVNTLAMRNLPEGDKTFAEFLDEVRENTLKAYENQEYQFEDLVERLSLVRDAGRNPLFDVMLAVQDADRELESIKRDTGINPDALVKEGQGEVTSSVKFDITLTAIDKGNRLDFNMKYCTSLFKQETMLRFIAYFKSIISGIIRDSDQALFALEIISADEKQRLIHDFNGVEADIPWSATIPSLFEAQASRMAENMAVTVNADQLTYGELNRRAGQLARILRSRGLTVNSIAGLMTGRSLDMIVGIIGILTAGGAYLPLDPSYPGERRRLMLADSNVRILVVGGVSGGTGTVAKPLPGGLDHIVRVNDIDDKGDGVPNLPVINRPGDLAYVIYTSGTSGMPRGVLVSHGNVINLCVAIREIVLKYEESANVALVSPYVFDASVKQIFPALLSGHHLVIVPEETRLEGERLIRYLTERAVRVSDGTPAHLSIILNEATELTGDIPVEKFVIGGEELDVNVAGRFFEKLNRDDMEIINVYGPTECSDVTSSFSVTPRMMAGLDRIPIGRPIPNAGCHVRGGHGELQPIGVPGELYITGAGVSRGYLNRPEPTHEKFLAGREVRAEEKREKYRIGYRTGDRVRWHPSGNMEFLGRSDEQVKIRGYRIELAEIESLLLRHPTIMNAVVVAQPDASGGRSLAAYVVLVGEAASGSSAFDEEIREYLSRTLPDYMVPSYFIQLDDIPVTFAGKVDRKALPLPEGATGGDIEAPVDQLEMRLLEIWSEVLGTDMEAIGVNADFFRLGGHSLLATVMVSKIHMALDIRIPLLEIFKSSTIKELARYIRTAEEEKFESIRPVEKREYYALSSAQRRLYILQQMDTGNVNYNMPYVIPLWNDIDEVGLQTTFNRLILRHESLRTSFQMLDDQPVQRVHNTADMTVQSCGHDTAESFIQPFDLSQAPLLRAGMFRTAGGEHILQVDMHHIVSDGISMQVLIGEFKSLYEDLKLPLLRIQYKDFAVWQNSDFEEMRIKNQENFWLEEFHGEVPVLNLPYDFSRPAVQSFEGNSISFEFDIEESTRLTEMALNHGATLFLVFTALFNLLLSKLSGEEDIVIGTPVAGRRHSDLDHVIGMFVNTLALRNYPVGEFSFAEFLREVKIRTLSAFENQEYPFERLVEQININRDVGRNPLFDVMLTLQTPAGVESRETFGNRNSVELNNKDYGTGISRFDMSWSVIEINGRLALGVDYCNRLFRQETIERFIAYFREISAAVTRNPGLRLGYIETVTGDEKRMILHDLNGTVTVYPRHRRLPELFEDQAAGKPDQVAIVFNDGRISYRELNRLADRLAVYLRDLDAVPGDIIALLFNRSFEMIVAMLSVLEVGSAYLPIEPDYPLERIEYMLNDSGAEMVLDDRSTGITDSLNCGVKVCGVHAIYDQADLPAAQSAQPARLGSSGPAYVIYTSGSTGRPKGVIIDHSAVINQIFCQKKRFGIDGTDRILQFSSYCFDASVEQIFMTLISGAVLVLVDKDTLLDKNRFEKYIARHRVTHVNAVPSFLMNIDFSRQRHLKRILAGGDICPVSLARRWCRDYDFYNKYGPTETTVVSIELLIKNSDLSGGVVPVGRPLDNTEVYILDRFQKPVPSGVIGELFIGGDGVGEGYLNKPELTAERFILYRTSQVSIDIGRNLLNQSPAPRLLYQTGDLARFMPGGNIEFLGRVDHQVKIRGFRIEMGEIETHLLNHDHIQDAVVTARKDGEHDQCLVAYIVARPADPNDQDSEASPDNLRRYLAASLPDHMLPSYFVPLEKIPLTPNGKVDRRALPKPVFKVKGKRKAPVSTIERKLTEIWSQILSIDIDMIGIDANFFELGGHSLKATIMSSHIHRMMDVSVPLKEIFRTPTIEGLSIFIREAAKDRFFSIEPVEKKEYFKVSSAQKRMYILQQMDAGDVNYNMPQAIPLSAEVDIENIELTFRKLILRHESLRTSFEMLDDEPVQRIHSELDFKIEFYSPDSGDKFVKSFDLSKAPLLRVGLLGHHSQEGKTVLLVDMHHIISDGVSLDLLKREFLTMFSGEQLPPLRLQYKDFAVWQNLREQREKVRDQEEYWLAMFSHEIPVLHLPNDYPRPSVQSFDGSHVVFEIGESEAAVLKRWSLHNGLTMYMALLAVFNILLAKLSSQDDIIVGTPVAGRRHPDLQSIIGLFVNTLALRNNPCEDMTLKDFLGVIKENILTAFENQEYPFEDLVERVELKRDTGQNPLFNVMFSLQEVDTTISSPIAGQPALEGDQAPDLIFNRISKFDLSLDVVVSEELSLSFEYCTKLFKRETIVRFAGYFKKILDALIRDAGQKIYEIDILGDDEKIQLLDEFNDTACRYSKNKMWPEIFEDQINRTPDFIALVGSASISTGTDDPHQLTYKELDKKSGQLTSILTNHGVLSNVPVGIMIERSPEMIIGMLGVLKVGGGYLPMDTAYPLERKRYIMEDSALKLLLIGRGSQVLPKIDFRGEVIELGGNPIFEGHVTGEKTITTSENFAYIIYTSGTTGRPKGVMVNHGNLLAYVFAFQREFNLNSRDVVLQQASFSFDAFVEEVYPILSRGGKVCIARPHEVMDHRLLATFILQHHITMISCSPLLLNELNKRDHLKSVHTVISGGDVLQVDNVDRFFNTARVYNTYGPTETTVCVTYHKLSDKPTVNVPIGSPISNYQVRILDKKGKLLPIGVPGEIWVSGDGISRGYLNEPEKTAEKFINPGDSDHNWYRTGDRGRWLGDGNIEFLGRVDRQVKIRGYRIELEEIEACLLSIVDIKEVVVIDRQAKDRISLDTSDRYLCGYIVTEGSYSESFPELRDYLSDRLPHYMIPSYFIKLDKIPITVHGKLDRRALPEPAVSLPVEYTAPEDPIEEKLAVIWSEVLRKEKSVIDVNTDFFRLGGHSLKATVLVSKIKRELAVELPLLEIFKSPTIRMQGEYIRARQGTTEGNAGNNLLLLNDEIAGGPSLFLIHDGTGEVSGYLEFCRHLKSEFNCRGIRADRLNSIAPLAVTIEQLALDYIGKIKTLQPQGPYYVLGWSLGGTIAFEMVRQMERVGEEIALLALVDAPGPDKSLKKDNETFSSEIDLDIHRTLGNARDAYFPETKINTPVHYFKANRSRGRYWKRWRSYCLRQIRLYEIKGDHYSIFEIPGVIELARRFDRVIAAL